MTILVGFAACVSYRPVEAIAGQAAMQRLTKRVSQAGDLKVSDAGASFTHGGTAPAASDAFIEHELPDEA
jgi:hypothetical protein